jgi:hypothetical protein
MSGVNGSTFQIQGARNMSQKENPSSPQEHSRSEKFSLQQEKFVRSDSGEAEVPPIIVKGGSLDVEFPRVPFEDASTGSPVVLAIGPVTGEGHVGRIALVEYRHRQTKEVIAFLRRPANLPHEDCLITVWDDQ